MKISAFSMCRNADRFYYPVRHSILSALPLVDEFVIAVGKGTESDRTLEILQTIDSDKLKIITTEWDLERYPKGTVHAQQSDLAKSHCTGDWLLYLQADEVIHEADYPVIRDAISRADTRAEVEGVLFQYLHFWGDYQHVVDSHGWYKKEIRLIRNRPEIHSWQSAQSFRLIPEFDGKSYRQKEGTQKLKVLESQARIFHYGWVRPPEIMSAKVRELDQIHSHQQERYAEQFNYGDLSKLTSYQGSHPAVMEEWMAKMSWGDQLQSGKQSKLNRELFKHERAKYKTLTWLERNVFGNNEIAGFKNYELLE